jgi:transcriptional regulator with XRE-family HTH domain
VAKTVEQTQAGGKSSKDTGRHLRQVRRKQGLSRSEVARSAGLTRRELAAYERGRIVIPESDLWCLAGSCGVDVNELLPGREPLKVGSGLSSLAMGDSIRRLRDPAPPDGLLREYLSMVYELRNLPPGSRVPLREPDLVALAEALGGTPGAIEARLVELIGASQEEAARLRAMILPPLSLPSAPQSGPSAPQSGDTSVYSSFGTPDPESPVVDFFSAPRAQDPFSPQPSPVAMPMPAMEADASAPDTQAPGTATDPSGAPIDPLSTLPRDPFALPGSESTTLGADVDDTRPDPFDPLVPGEASEPVSDPFAVPMPTLRSDPFGLTPPAPNGHDGIDGFVVDVLEGPLTDAASAYAVPDDAATDWTGLRDAAAVAEAPPAVVLRDGGRDDTTIDDTTIDDTTIDDTAPEPLDTTPILWRAPHDTTATGVVPGELHTPARAAPFQPAGTGWQIGGLFPATSMADDGALALRRADTRWALSDLVAAGDVTIEVVLDYSAGAGFGVLFRASVDEHKRVTGYSFDLDPATSGGGYLLQHWADDRPHWRPIVQVPVTDPAGLYGRHMVALTVQGDRLTVCVDAETVLTVAALSRASIDLGREPCRGSGLGVHAGATTELTVETLRAAQP